MCGNFTGLLPGKRFARKNNKVLILVLGLVCGLTIFVTAIVITLILHHKLKAVDGERKQNFREDQPESLIWERERKFTFGEIVEATEDFDDKYCIGKGGVGTVYKAVLRSGLVLAVKRLHMSDSSDIPEICRTSFQNEIRSLTEVRHRNIIMLYGFCSKKGCMYLVYEFAKRGGLANALYGNSEKRAGNLIDWDERVRIVQGLAHALSYLHHDCFLPIVHRDVSLNNILLGADSDPRFSDFGTARLLSPDSSNWINVAGSYGYMAPGNTLP